MNCQNSAKTSAKYGPEKLIRARVHNLHHKILLNRWKIMVSNIWILFIRWQTLYGVIFFRNIYQCILLDIIYQLLKGVVRGRNMLQPFKKIVEAKFKRACFKADGTRSFNQAKGTILSDEQFCFICFYLIQKIFNECSELKQWDGS